MNLKGFIAGPKRSPNDSRTQLMGILRDTLTTIPALISLKVAITASNNP
jgi:hypothetical protein